MIKTINKKDKVLSDRVRYKQKLARLRYKDLILKLHRQGKSYTQITDLINKRLKHTNLKIQLSKTTIYNIVKKYKGQTKWQIFYYLLI